MKLRNLLVIVAVLALVATACGGGAEETTTTAGTDGTTATTADSGETTTTTEETTATEGGGGSSAALASLRESMSSTREATKGRMEGSITITGAPDLPGGMFTMPFSGAFDNEAGNFSFIMDMSFMASQFGEDVPPEMAGLLGEMEMRTIGDTSYIRFPFFSMFLGAETEWIATPAEEGMDATSGFGGSTPSNPADFLEYFEEANGTVEDLGREEIRGVDTTHFLVVFDMEDLLENATPEQRAEIEAEQLPLDELAMDIWIGDDGLVYKYVVEIDGAELDTPEEEGFDSMVMDFEMFDYDADIVIEAPEEFTEMDSLDLGVPEF